MVESLFACLFGEGGIHVGPLIVFAGCCVGKVLHCAWHGAAVKQLEPQFGVFALIARRFFKQLCYLHISVFFCL